MKILAIDPGTACGWAVRMTSEDYASGVWDLASRRHEGGGMRFLRLRKYLREVLDSEKPDAVVYEEVRMHMGIDAAHVYGGIVAVLSEECESRKVPYTAVHYAHVKKLATGKGNAPHVLYRLPDVTAAARTGDTIFIVEGEKDADRLARNGLIATTSANGAGDWQNEYTQQLAGTNVVIIPDADQAGWDHAIRIEEALIETAKSVKTVLLPVAPKQDVSDWFDQGHTIVELLALAADTPTIQPPVEFQFDTGDIIYTAAQPDPIWGDDDDLLWTREEPLMIYGPTGLGKTTIAGQLALSLIGIGPTQLLGHTIHPLPPDKTILYVAADRPRQAMRSLRRMVTSLDKQTLTNRLLIERRRQISSPEGDVTLILRAAQQANAGVVILDSAKDIAGGPLKEEAPAKALMDSIQHCIAWFDPGMLCR